METNRYSNPLVERYSSEEMLYIFSPDKKFSSWRKLWIALAESEKELGLKISEEQVAEMKKYQNEINYDVAREKEKEVRHDVMAHVYAFGEQAKKAKPIIHLGATSAYVGDNTDLIQIKEALELTKKKLVNVMSKMKDFAYENKDLPTLGFTHFQPAQLTTVGKRATLWLQSLVLDYEELDFRLETLRFRGVKGTTGTQASFMELFNNDESKVKELDIKVTEKLGFNRRFMVTGQTYDRKVDSQVLNLLSQLAQSAHKFSNDLRLLQNLKEVEEPFGKKQIGSSAMAYKRNPMRSERIGSLSRFVMALTNSVSFTAATQWFERTLDDSANKRLSIPQAFLAVDAILTIWVNVLDGLVIYPKMIEKRIMSELPFMSTEYIIMEGVKNGGDRQELHERIRVHSMEAAKQVKEEGKDNDLIERILKDDYFDIDKNRLLEIMDPKNFIGRSAIQTEEFLEEEVKPIIESNKELIGMEASLKV